MLNTELNKKRVTLYERVMRCETIADGFTEEQILGMVTALNDSNLNLMMGIEDDDEFERKAFMSVYVWDVLRSV